MKKRYMLWSGYVATIAIITFIMIRVAGMESASQPVGDTDVLSEEARELLQPREDDWFKGNPDADVVVVKFSDFHCPACRNYAAMDDMLSNEMGDDVLFIFRHYPISQFSAFVAQFVEAAGRQGKFWEMHDLVYINRQKWTTGDPEPVLKQLAEALELDMEQFQRDLEDETLFERIQTHHQIGRDLDVRAVPTIFINGEHVVLPRTIEDYRSLVESYM